ncbi:MAG TPA: hypothetical protein DD490_21430 [Acidobacteria bacterium]|nr:hypothetical protein [Acidobacteriota bacterium]
MTHWHYYPRSRKAPPLVHAVVQAFRAVAAEIDSEHHNLPSNGVLARVAPRLVDLGFRVETGKASDQKIQVPVLFGLDGQYEKSFEVDAYHEDAGFVLEVEAGRGVVNNQFLKDLFQACMMNGVTEFAVALRNDYRGTNDFEKATRFFDTLYASQRLKLPLAGVLLIGY